MKRRCRTAAVAVFCVFWGHVRLDAGDGVITIRWTDGRVISHRIVAGTVPGAAARPRAARVRGFAVDGELANWDADREPDGIAMRVVPFGDGGEPVHVEGSLDVRLSAPVRAEYDGAPQSRGEVATRIGHWIRPIAASEPNAEMRDVLLPFGAYDPDTDARIGNFGILDVRLVVPGQGVFERRIDVIRIRPHSPLRDRKAFR